MSKALEQIKKQADALLEAPAPYTTHRSERNDNPAPSGVRLTRPPERQMTTYCDACGCHVQRGKCKHGVFAPNEGRGVAETVDRLIGYAPPAAVVA